MYNCRFVGDSTFRFGYDYGTIFDLEPLSELDVEVSTSQGFQQVGTTVEAETVGGISREIKGVFIDRSDVDIPKRMLSTFIPGMHGKLYFDDIAYCECVVQKTPAITLEKNKRTFSLMLYCAYPYWLDVTTSTYLIGGYTAEFEFPVCYDEHTFGTKSDELFTNCINSGMVEVPYTIQFTASATVVNYGIENVYTDEILQLEDTLESGETVKIYRDSGRLKVEKTVDGVTSDIFSALTEDSTLFSMAVGDNVIQQFADSGSDQLVCYITFNPASVGVIADD